MNNTLYLGIRAMKIPVWLEFDDWILVMGS